MADVGLIEDGINCRHCATVDSADDFWWRVHAARDERSLQGSLFMEHRGQD